LARVCGYRSKEPDWGQANTPQKSGYRSCFPNNLNQQLTCPLGGIFVLGFGRCLVRVAGAWLTKGARRFITGAAALLAGGSIFAPLLLHGVGQGDDLQSGAFRKKVADILHRSHPDLKPGLPDDPALIELGSKTIFLGNLYAYVHDLETEGQEIEIAKFLETTLQPSTPTSAWKEAVDQLRIQIIPIEYRKVQLANKGALITRDFTPRVLITYALDNAQSYELVTTEMLRQWNC